MPRQVIVEHDDPFFAQEKGKRKRDQAPEQTSQAQQVQEVRDPVVNNGTKKMKNKKPRQEEVAVTTVAVLEEGIAGPAVEKRKKQAQKNAPSSEGTEKAAAGLPLLVEPIDVDEYRLSLNITVEGDDVPPPLRSFENAGFPENVLVSLREKYSKPTPIQAQGWPVALSGRDLVGLAETGSGKTLAFILPAVVHILNLPKSIQKKKDPKVLVMAPTRELAQQIQEVAEMALARSEFRSVCVYGGIPKTTHTAALRSRVDILVGTPGRLIDLMGDNEKMFDEVSYLVLDEADRMLDMGFELQIRQIVNKISTDRQTLMWSATWPSDVQRLAGMYFKNPIKICVGNHNLAGNTRIQQIIHIIDDTQRMSEARKLLRKLFVNGDEKILVFMLYKRTCAKMAQLLERDNFPAIALHGDLSQVQRNSAIAAFKSSDKPILVATDVAARGLDIKGVQYVLNVEFPLKCEDYVHRIGRTGRAGETGIAHTFFSVSDKPHARELVNIIKESGQPISKELQDIADKAPPIKPKKTELNKLYGEFVGDPRLAQVKATRIVFDEDN